MRERVQRWCAQCLAMLEFKFLHTSNVFLMKMHHWTSHMAPQKHEIIKKTTVGKGIFEIMKFHDLGPCRAPKMRPSRRRILIDNFCFKTTTRINIPPFQTTSTHQTHSNTTVKYSKIAHPKIMNIHWSEDPSKAPKSSFTKHQ